MVARRLLAALLVVVAAACSRDAGASGSSGAARSASPSAGPTSRFPRLGQAQLLSMSRPVRFEGAGGVRLGGRVFGSGDLGVVLSHMQPGDQSQWLPFAGLLAQRGYRVLTFDRRGVCPGGDLGCSQGGDQAGSWKDLSYAVDLLRSRGSGTVVVGGASLGAMESLYALSRGLDADGLIWLSGLDLYEGTEITRQLKDVPVPALFMAGAFDPNAAPLGQAIERAASAPVQIVKLQTGEHGTDILDYGDPAVADRLRQTVLDFLAGL